MQADVAEAAASLAIDREEVKGTDPSSPTSWHFGGLAAHEWLPKLLARLSDNESHHPLPQLCWLHNDGQPVIGLLPKVAWRVYPADPAGGYQADKEADKEVAITVVKNTRAIDPHLPQPSPQQELRYITTYQKWIEELIAYSQYYGQPDAATDPIEQTTGNHYRHGLMGFIGYDIAAQQLSPQSGITVADQPSAYLGHYDIYLSPCDQGWQLTVDPSAQSSLPSAYYQTLIAQLTWLDEQLTPAAPPIASSLPSLPALSLTASWHYDQYQLAFSKIQQYLYEGDSYQINLTQPWQGVLANQEVDHGSLASMKLLPYLTALHNNTGAPFAGYIGLTDFELLSCSPELFLVFEKAEDGAHHIQTKPIKGTRPRGHNAHQDQALREELAASDKDRAENVMIVDLLRNDLGKYAQTGSVKVPKLFAIESFSNVHHMVSTITATIKEQVHPLSVLFGSLPAGSITGTPKKRAVEIIAELEVAPRGAYCGTLGYMNFDGTGQWNVLIRSLQAQQAGQISLWAGGGITVGSDCAAEYQECVDKVGNLLAVLAKH